MTPGGIIISCTGAHLLACTSYRYWDSQVGPLPVCWHHFMSLRLLLVLPGIQMR